MPDPLDDLVEDAGKLVVIINAILQNHDTDAALGALAKLMALYLQTLPPNARENELQDWLRLVRKLARPVQQNPR